MCTLSTCVELPLSYPTAIACIRMQYESILGNLGVSLMGHWVIWVSKYDLVAALVEIVINQQIAIEYVYSCVM